MATDREKLAAEIEQNCDWIGAITNHPYSHKKQAGLFADFLIKRESSLTAERDRYSEALEKIKFNSGKNKMAYMIATEALASEEKHG